MSFTLAGWPTGLLWEMTSGGTAKRVPPYKRRWIPDQVRDDGGEPGMTEGSRDDTDKSVPRATRAPRKALHDGVAGREAQKSHLWPLRLRSG